MAFWGCIGAIGFIACGSDGGGTETVAPDAQQDSIPAADAAGDIVPSLDLPKDAAPQPDTSADTLAVDVGSDSVAPPDSQTDMTAPPDTTPPEPDVPDDVPTIDISDTSPPADVAGPKDSLPADVPPADADQPAAYVWTHTFNNVELDPTGVPLLQTALVSVPKDTVSVEAQIAVRGDLDYFPAAFITFVIVNKEGKFKQCGNLSGMPQKPNNIQDDVFRIAFPRPANLYKGSVYYPPGPPYDFQPVPCQEAFLGKEQVEVGLLGVGIYAPGVGGNKGCGGAGCPNDARVKLRFKTTVDPPPSNDVIEPPDVVEPPKDTPDVDEPAPPGSCQDPTPLALWADQLTTTVEQSVTMTQQAWPPTMAACPQTKPPFSIETYFQLDVSQYGIVTVDLVDYDPPWNSKQYYLGLQKGCGVMDALQCGKSSTGIYGAAQPGSYVVGLTLAPSNEVFIPDQDWSVTLKAELMPMTWGQATTIALHETLDVALNNAAVAVRDAANQLHVIWVQEGQPHYGRRADNQWTTGVLNTLTSGAVAHPTLASPDGITLLATWTEAQEPQGAVVVAAHSANSGQDWSAPMALTSAGSTASNPALHGFVFGGQPRAVVAWHEGNTQGIRSRAWNGASWAVASWTAGVDVDSGAATSKGVALAGSGGTLHAVWEDDRNGPTQVFYAQSATAGQDWSADALLDVGQGGAGISTGQAPSIAVSGAGDIYVAYSDNGTIYMAQSDDSGITFAPWGLFGPGLAARLSTNSSAGAAATWELTKDGPANNANKRLGSLITLDAFTHAIGPFFVPDTVGQFHYIRGTVAMSDGWMDVLWVDVSQAKRRLMHRQVSLP